MTIHEPATFLTDGLLGLLGAWCGWRLSRDANPAQRCWSRALWLTAAAAWVGGTHHGLGPALGERAGDILWRATLLLISLTSVAMSLTLVRELAPAAQCRRWGWLVWIKFASFATVSFAYPLFAVAVADYGLSMLALGVAALFAHRPWRGPMFAGVMLSALAATVQQMQWGFGARFNHNDTYHVIQGAAVFIFYRAGRKLGTPKEGEGK